MWSTIDHIRIIIVQILVKKFWESKFEWDAFIYKIDKNVDHDYDFHSY